MTMKTIRVTGESHKKLTHSDLKSETDYNIIARLTDVYKSNCLEEFSDEEAYYYNERIRRFENGDYTDTRKIDLNAMER